MGFKSNDVFQINQAHWKKNKPLTLKTTGLGAVMEKYQKAKTAATDISKTGKVRSGEERNNPPFDVALAMLGGELKKAVEKAKGMCNKTLHSDAISYLGRYASIVDGEKKALALLKSAFETQYDTNIFQPIKKQGDVLLQTFIDDKNSSHIEYKKAEDLVGKIASVLKGANAMKKQKGATPKDFEAMADQANKYLVDLKKACKLIHDFDVKSQQNEPIVQSLKSNRDIFEAERTTLMAYGVKVRPIWATMTMYNNKAKLFLANAEANVRDVENIAKGTASDTGVKSASNGRDSHLKSVKAIAEALKGWGEDSRRQNNNMTPWQADLQKFVQAQAQATKSKKPIEDVAKDLNIPIPPDQWKTLAKKYLADAPGFMKKTEKMKKQAIELKEKTLAKVPKDLLDDNEFKPLILRINNYIKEVTEYADVKNKNSFEDLQRLEKLIK